MMPDNTVEADVTRDALVREHSARLTPGPKVTLPGGKRISAAPYLAPRVASRRDATMILGNPAAYLKKPKRDCLYLWRVRDDPTTGGMVAAQEIRPVQMDEVDRTKKVAPITELKTPSGDYVLWKNMALFEMPPDIVYETYQVPADEALHRISAQAATWEDKIDAASGGAYKGTIQRKDNQTA